MFAIDVRWAVIAESVLPPHAPRDLSDDPPVGPRLTGQRQKGPLTADQPFGIGDGAVLFAPRRCGQLYMRIAAGVSVSDRSEEHTSELQSLMRISYAVFCLQKKTNN